MTQYSCHWCGGLVNQENAVVYQRRNIFDNWLGNDYYHPECYPKWQQRQKEINKEEEDMVNVFKWTTIAMVVITIVLPIIAFFILPYIH
jgi:hypothetical protein